MMLRRYDDDHHHIHPFMYDLTSEEHPPPLGVLIITYFMESQSNRTRLVVEKQNRRFIRSPKGAEGTRRRKFIHQGMCTRKKKEEKKTETPSKQNQ